MANRNYPTFPQPSLLCPGNGNPWFTLSAMRRVSHLTFAPELPGNHIHAMMGNQLDSHDGLSRAVCACPQHGLAAWAAAINACKHP